MILADRWDLNTQASGRNAGSLHGQIQHAPFLERGEDWAVAFLEALRFLRESLDIWNGLSIDLNADLEVNLGGGLLVAETEEQLNDIRRKARIEESAGIHSDLLDAAELQMVAPYLSSAMAGAQLCHVEGKANPLLAGPAFARAATELGARVIPQTNVHNITPEGSRFIAHTAAGSINAGRVVVATGNHINEIADLWGEPLPVTDEPVQVSATETLTSFVHHLVYFAGDKLTFKQAKAGTLSDRRRMGCPTRSRDWIPDGCRRVATGQSCRRTQSGAEACRGPHHSDMGGDRPCDPRPVPDHRHPWT